MSEPPILEVSRLSKAYGSGERLLVVLSDVDLAVDRGTTCAIVGPSGSGKSTLLGLCAGLDEPSSGSVRLNGVALETLSEDERARRRNLWVGFVFQNFQLIPTLSAVENVMVPLELRATGNPRAAAVELLDRVGLADRLAHYPGQLSGGEQQRVALARAFINTPEILFVDEPTGNLDTETSATVEDLLFELNREMGTTLILVTHDLDLAHRTQRMVRLRGGRIAEDSRTFPRG
jgi:putative ABC transport system ATP-binding protein